MTHESPTPRYPAASSRRLFLGAAAGSVWTGMQLTEAESRGQSVPALTAEQAGAGATANPRLFSFIGGEVGEWRVRSITAVTGETLPMAQRLTVIAGEAPALPASTAAPAWILRGVTSNERYVTRPEKEQLVAKQAAIGRPTATHAALIPIRKSAAWWTLTQDERRSLFEEQSHHIQIGLKYLPAIARRLHHCRDLETREPFDFLTFFDYAEADEPAFNDMLAQLRAIKEWTFIDREVDIRLVRAD